jgi:formyl-CoA transferase/CoA:oxalate CoA-transferase
MEAPLAGLRVIDFGMAAVGPIAAEYLGFLGADVIKVESPSGDVVRHGEPKLQGTCATFLGNNLNKRGVIFDLKTEEGVEQALRLIATADIVLDNFRSPDIMRRLGLAYERMRQVNPRVIYLQGSAYGPRGPLYGMTSNEWFSQAAAGLTSLSGQEGGKPEFSRGTATLDWNGAFTNLQALLVALWVREHTGRGMFVQTSQMQSTIVAATTRIAEVFATGQASPRMGSARPNVVPDQAFATRDGYISVSVPHDAIWPRLCAAIDRPELASDARFATNADRLEHRAEVVALLAEAFADDDSATWIGRLHTAGVPAARFTPTIPISDGLLAEPQVQAEDLVTMLDTPYGQMASAQPHWHFDKTEARITRFSPRHGEHTAEILAELDAAEASPEAVAR